MAPDSPLLSRFLKDVNAGQLQLPDFQREWKWDDDRIRSLLATLTLGYPMGVVMTLETGGDGPRFKQRPLAGVELSGDSEPDQLLLDGQQRLTSLYQALSSGKPVLMHFNSEPLSREKLDHLHKFAAWLRRLDPRP